MLNGAVSEWLVAFGARDAGVAAPFAPATLKQALDGALELGRGAGCLPEAMRVLADIELRLAALGTRMAIDRRAGTVAGEPAPRVAVVGAVNRVGLVLSGRWVPDLAALAGAEAVLTTSGGRDVAATPGELARAGAGTVVLAIPGALPADALNRYRQVSISESWQPLDGARVVALDGNRFVTVPGPALPRAVELLGAAVHGDAAGVSAAKEEMLALEPARPGNEGRGV